MNRFLQPWLCGLLLAVVTAGAHAAQLPPFQLVRAEEDWSVLRDPALRDLAPEFKYIPLGDGRQFLSLGGEWRERFDHFTSPRFGIGARADDYVLQRILVHADLHLGERVRVFAQLGHEEAIGKEDPLAPSDADRGDLQNLFIDTALGGERSVQLRLGRQELMFNPTQRFVSVREGPNVRQSFDGARLGWHAGPWRLDAFATRPVEYRVGSFDDRADESQAFYGVYATRQLTGSSTIDLYAMGLERDRVRFGARTGDEHRRSFGARLATRAGKFDLEAEAVIQRGTFAAGDIRAWALSGVAGYTFEAGWSPRFGLQLDAGSGDRGRADRLETFNPMFPRGAYFNESSLNSWANSLVARPSLTVHPSASLSVQVSVAGRWRQSERDAVYLQPYTPIDATMGNQARRVGETWQLDIAWKVSRAVTVTVQALHQDVGEAISRAGGSDVDFATLNLQYRF